MFSNVKITVVKKFSPEDVFGHQIIDPPSGQVSSICSLFEERQEFVVEGLRKPEGFCDWAWNDLFKDILILSFGGEHDWTESGVMYTSCTDGKRPVCFELKRLDS